MKQSRTIESGNGNMMGYPYYGHSQSQSQHRGYCPTTMMPFPPQQPVPPPMASITPYENDVLMGRGGKNNIHCGNEAFRELARQQVTKYQEADKKEKSTMSIELVAQVKAMTPAGRFLKRDPMSLAWQLVPDELSREKASQCLRDAVAQLKNRRNSNSSSESSKKENSSQPKPIMYHSAPESPKRKAASPFANLEPISTNKRGRTKSTENTHDDATVGSIFSIPFSVITESLDQPIDPRNSSIQIHEEATVVSNHQCPTFDFDLFNCDDLINEDILIW